MKHIVGICIISAALTACQTTKEVRHMTGDFMPQENSFVYKTALSRNMYERYWQGVRRNIEIGNAEMYNNQLNVCPNGFEIKKEVPVLKRTSLVSSASDIMEVFFFGKCL